MKIKDNHDVNHFILFLENHDGSSFNSLMQDLCKIYADSQESAFDYLPSAVSRAAVFVNSWYLYYWKKYAEDKDFFPKNIVAVTCFVATELAISAQSEFKLGNVY